MQSQPASAQPLPEWTVPSTARAWPLIDSQITWLLHRAAQRMRGATGGQAEQYGIQLRDYIVLSALGMHTGLTQIELAKSLGLDKTTLMIQLDRLERMGLAVRRSDPRDRRRRIPECTEAGEAVRATVANGCASVEAELLSGFSQDQVQTLRRMLVEVIGDSEDRGSCM